MGIILSTFHGFISFVISKVSCCSIFRAVHTGLGTAWTTADVRVNFRRCHSFDVSWFHEFCDFKGFVVFIQVS